MTPELWTLVYGFVLMIILIRTGIDAGDANQTDGHKWIIAILAGLILLISVFLGYAAGAYVAVTGNPGSMGWFGVWISLTICGTAKIIYDMITKGLIIPIIIHIITLILLYQMGAFANFSNF